MQTETEDFSFLTIEKPSNSVFRDRNSRFWHLPFPLSMKKISSIHCQSSKNNITMHDTFAMPIFWVMISQSGEPMMMVNLLDQQVCQYTISVFR
jgi:hypothetical protein